MPERRTSLVSVRDRNTRRLACEPVGVPISVFSLANVAVKFSESWAPPVTPPIVPAAAGLSVARR